MRYFSIRSHICSRSGVSGECWEKQKGTYGFTVHCALISIYDHCRVWVLVMPTSPWRQPERPGSRPGRVSKRVGTTGRLLPHGDLTWRTTVEKRHTKGHTRRGDTQTGTPNPTKFHMNLVYMREEKGVTNYFACGPCNCLMVMAWGHVHVRFDPYITPLC